MLSPRRDFSGPAAAGRDFPRPAPAGGERIF